MSKLFGTDGIRGIANKELTPMLAFNIARASVYVLEKEIGTKPTILIGKDTRISGDMIETAMISGFTSAGACVRILGVIPTPAVSYLVVKYHADAGVVITASHNPYEFNGIKYFSNKGIKLPDEVEEMIEEEYFQDCKNVENIANDKIGFYGPCEKARNDYIDFTVSTANLARNNIRIVVDCSNGATSKFAEKIFKKIGLEGVNVINCSPDGTNINKNCGSLHMGELSDIVVRTHADLGIAFDGDGDRMLAVDDKGNIVDGDMVIALCSKMLKDHNRLKNNTIVATVMSNMGLLKFAKENDINVVQTKVGDKYVLQSMMDGDYSLGGEQSGHIIFKDINPTGDGIITAIQLLSMYSNYNKSLSELLKVITIYPQVTVNAKVDNDQKYNYIEDVEITEAIWNVEKELGDEGRILVRPSGTEPYVRVMIEGKDIDDITSKAKKIAKMIEKVSN